MDVATTTVIERALSRKTNEDGVLHPVVDVRLPCTAGQTWTIWGLFDVHADSTDCHRKMLEKDIERIMADPLARVIVGGDFNDMIFHGDPRYTPGGLLRWLAIRADAADAVVEYNLELLAPLRDRIDLYISGNHEEGFAKRHSTNVARRTAKELGVPFASYFALLRYHFENANGMSRRSRGWIHHGFGGSAPVTKGMIQLERVAAQNRYDWQMLGHIHQRTFSETAQFDDSGTFGNGAIQQVPIAGAICGTYKRNYAGGETACWSAQKGHAPAALGAGRMYLDIERDNANGLTVRPRIN